MRAFFLSDVHISTINDLRQKLLINFINELIPSDILIFVGDIFDIWYDFNDVIYYDYVPILSSLHEASKRGIKIIYFEGNHDFHIGNFFKNVIKAKVYTSGSSYVLNDMKLFIAHGDTIDEKDIKSRALRTLLRTYFAKIIMKRLSPSYLKGIARLFSKNRNSPKVNSDLNALFKSFAETKWAQGYDGVVLGHLHSPEFTAEEIDGHYKFYANLGDWITHYTYLKYEDGIFCLMNYKAD